MPHVPHNQICTVSAPRQHFVQSDGLRV